jgi:hypothetical protein
MLVECLTLRAGATPVTIKDHIYEFMPIPGAQEGEMTSSVANVSNQEAVDYLIGNPEKNIKGRPNFRPYKPSIAQADLMARRREMEAKSGRMNGYSIEVMRLGDNDKGYMILHVDGSKPRTFCGINGVFSEDIQKIIPFSKISDADSFLRAYAAGQELPRFEPHKDYVCKEEGCTEEFDDPVSLADHWQKAHAHEPADVKVDPKVAIAEKLGKSKYAHVPGEAK